MVSPVRETSPARENLPAREQSPRRERSQSKDEMRESPEADTIESLKAKGGRERQAAARASSG